MTHDRLVIAILAAGGSRRLGRPKQLEAVGGEPLIHRQARVAIDASIGPVGVVLGCAIDACRAAVADLEVAIVPNDAWADGLSTSLRVAVAFARDREASGLLILLGDQYGITTTDLRSLAATWREEGTKTTIATRHADAVPGPPAILPRDRFDALDQLHGDAGARSVLAAATPLLLLDLDAARLDLDDEHDATHARGDVKAT